MEALHHGGEMRHVARADQPGRVGQPAGVPVAGRAQQQRGRVDRAARNRHQRRARADDLAVALHLDRRDPPAGRVGEQPARVRVGPQPHVVPARAAGGRSSSPPRSWRGAGRETSCTCCRGCSRPALPAAAGPAAGGGRMEALLPQPPDHVRDLVGVGYRRVGERAARRLGRIVTPLAVQPRTAARRGRSTARASRSRSARRARARRRARSPRSPPCAAGTARCPRTWCCRPRSSACKGGTRGPAASSQRSVVR